MRPKRKESQIINEKRTAGIPKNKQQVANTTHINQFYLYNWLEQALKPAILQRMYVPVIFQKN
jgi:hypothetical protein